MVRKADVRTVRLLCFAIREMRFVICDLIQTTKATKYPKAVSFVTFVVELAHDKSRIPDYVADTLS